MKKIEYSSPKMKIVALKRRANLLQASYQIDHGLGFNAPGEMAPKA